MTADEFREPPDFSKKKLDFSQFHPIDHVAFSSRCRSFYGGGWRHLSLRWDFFVHPWIRSHTTCVVGLHERGQTTYPSKRLTWVSCAYCDKQLSEKQEY